MADGATLDSVSKPMVKQYYADVVRVNAALLLLAEAIAGQLFGALVQPVVS